MSAEYGPKHNEESRTSTPVSFFDVDGTITQGFAILSFAKHLEQRGILTPAMLGNMLGDLERYTQSNRRSGDYHSFAVDIVDHYAEGLTGHSQLIIEQEGHSFFDAVAAGTVEDYSLMPFTRELLRLMNRLGPTIAISGSPIDALRPLTNHIGMYEVYGTTFTAMDGVYTGEVDKNLAVGQTKHEKITAIINSGTIDLSHSFAFGDSMTDLPLLEVVGHPFIIGNNAELQELGEMNRWSIVRDPSGLLEQVVAMINSDARQ